MVNFIFTKLYRIKTEYYQNPRPRRAPSGLPLLLDSSFLLVLAPVVALSLALSQSVLAQVLALALSLAISEPVMHLLLSFSKLYLGVVSTARLASLLALARVLALSVALSRR